MLTELANSRSYFKIIHSKRKYTLKTTIQKSLRRRSDRNQIRMFFGLLDPDP